MKEKQSIKVDKDIPIPTKHHLTKYPFANMEIGDSFAAGTYSSQLGRSVRSAITNYAKKNPDKKFIIRKYEGKVRCWRMK